MLVRHIAYEDLASPVGYVHVRSSQESQWLTRRSTIKPRVKKESH